MLYNNTIKTQVYFKRGFMAEKDNVKKCVLFDRDCENCGECEFCDLDPTKLCDNCGKCLNMDDFATIKIDGVYAPAKEGEFPSHKTVLTDDFKNIDDGEKH